MNNKELTEKVLKKVEFREDNITSIENTDEEFYYVEDYCFREDVKNAISLALKEKKQQKEIEICLKDAEIEKVIDEWFIEEGLIDSMGQIKLEELKQKLGVE